MLILSRISFNFKQCTPLVMGMGTKPVWKCDVCNHEWLSRNDSMPLRCACCKTPYWNKFENDKKKSLNSIQRKTRRDYE